PHIAEAHDSEDLVVAGWWLMREAVGVALAGDLTGGATIAAQACGQMAKLGVAHEDRPYPYSLAVDMPGELRHRATRDRITAPPARCARWTAYGRGSPVRPSPSPDYVPYSSSGRTSMPASLRCRSVMGVGAPVSGSPPLDAFGNAITSRIASVPARVAASRSRPNAMPPCGGGPNLNASSRKPNFDSASSRDSPITSKTRCCISARWIRIDPPPRSMPLPTTS